MSRSLFAWVVLAGILLRAAALPGRGTGDVTVWKVWSYNAARHGVGEMYGVGGTPPERRELEYAGATATVDYPPLALSSGLPATSIGPGPTVISPTGHR